MELLCGRNILLYLFVQFATSEFIETGIGRIEVFNELGEGSFGKVKRCRVEETGRDCAIKMELYNNQSTLPVEEEFYKVLGEHPGIPKMLYHGKSSKKSENCIESDDSEKCKEDVLILELVGPSLLDILEQKNIDSFSAKTVLMIGIQALYRIEYIHSKGILFMDNKPENWVVGGTNLTNSLLYFIDFGLSVFYIVNGKHVQEEPEEIGGTAAGTLRYLSIYAHRHKVLSRRDDIESIGYVLIYLLKGDVAWSSRTELSNSGKSERVLKAKRETSLEELIGDNPKQFYTYMKYARSLSFYQKPNYTYLRKLMRDALKAIGGVEDNIFDWSEPRRVVRINESENRDQLFWETRSRSKYVRF